MEKFCRETIIATRAPDKNWLFSYSKTLTRTQKKQKRQRSTQKMRPFCAFVRTGIRWLTPQSIPTLQTAKMRSGVAVFALLLVAVVQVRKCIFLSGNEDTYIFLFLTGGRAPASEGPGQLLQVKKLAKYISSKKIVFF